MKKPRVKSLAERYREPFSTKRIIAESVRRALMGESFEPTAEQRRLIEGEPLPDNEEPKEALSFTEEDMAGEEGLSIVLAVLWAEKERKVG